MAGSETLHPLIKNGRPMNLRNKFGFVAKWWFRPHAIEQDGEIYRPLGVRFAKRLLLATLGRLPRTNYRLEGSDIESLKTFDKWTIVGEAYHLALCLVFFGAVVWVFTQGRVPYQLMIMGCLLNVYLVLLQRYNRGRLRRVIQRLERKQQVNEKVQG
jgi:hypothetical protein